MLHPSTLANLMVDPQQPRSRVRVAAGSRRDPDPSGVRPVSGEEPELPPEAQHARAPVGQGYRPDMEPEGLQREGRSVLTPPQARRCRPRRHVRAVALTYVSGEVSQASAACCAARELSGVGGEAPPEPGRAARAAVRVRWSAQVEADGVRSASQTGCLRHRANSSTRTRCHGRWFRQSTTAPISSSAPLSSVPPCLRALRGQAQRCRTRPDPARRGVRARRLALLHPSTLANLMVDPQQPRSRVRAAAGSRRDPDPSGRPRSMVRTGGG